LKEDFPHIHLAPRELAIQLIEIGRNLVSLHLLESGEAAHVQLSGEGDRLVEKVLFAVDNGETGVVHINENQSIGPIPLVVWGFEVGAFPVLEKWLKERRHRRLSVDDLLTIQRIVGSIERTIELIADLDEAVEDAGGIPFVA
jgi:hypothetical protein